MFTAKIANSTPNATANAGAKRFAWAGGRRDAGINIGTPDATSQPRGSAAKFKVGSKSESVIRTDIPTDLRTDSGGAPCPAKAGSVTSIRDTSIYYESRVTGEMR